MTTNRMGLEQDDDYGLSAHLEVLEAMIEPGDTENQQLICLLLELKRRRATVALDESERAELLAYRKACKEADGDDNFYSWFSREWEQYYQPNQYTTSAKQHLGAIAESAWFACRAAMLKSVTNEP